MTTTYNLDRMQYRPGPPATFLAEHTPQGADWWRDNDGTPDADAIRAFLAEAHAALSNISAQHMARQAT